MRTRNTSAIVLLCGLLGTNISFGNENIATSNPAEKKYDCIYDGTVEGVSETSRHLVTRGAKLLNEKNIEEALEVYSRCIALFPKEPNCYRGAGIAHARLRHEEEAITLYKKYLELVKTEKFRFPDAIEDCAVNTGRKACLEKLRKSF